MRLKKIIIVLISLIMILNVIVPTIVLAANEVNEQNETNEQNVEETKTDNENNTTNKEDGNENTNTNVDNEDENSTTENESSENTVQDDVIDSEENTTVVDKENEQDNVESTEIKENATNMELQKETREETKIGMLNLETPTNGTTYYSQETSSINVVGWKMANVSNSYIKAFVNNNEINSENISYSGRQDVINAITGYGTAEQNPTPGFGFSIDTANLEDGEYTIKIELWADGEVLATSSVTINFSKGLHVQYRTHVQEEGWQGYVQDGEMSGTSGKAYRLEAINIQLVNNTENLGIKYQVHVQEEGWQDWKENGEMAGTQGKAYRLEAIRIELENSEDYSIMYRVHVQDIGWQDWCVDGEMAGTSGKALRLEAIEIKIVKKQSKGMLNLETPTNGTTYYSSQTSNINVAGWKMADVSNSYIKAFVNNNEINSENISYSGRQDVINAITGYGTAEQNPTPGFGFSIDTANLEDGEYTIKIELWADGEVLATSSVTINFSKGLHVQYRTHVQEEGWQGYVQDGEMSGTSGKAYRLEAINIQLVNNTENLGIKYQVHVQEEGWQDWKENGEMAGTQGKAYRLEAIRIELENSEDYSIMYRVHVQDIGWQDWCVDGEMAGTSGRALRLEAIEIKIVEKQKKAMLTVETPANGNTYYSSETQSINVTGWKMANVSNSYIKAYIDNKEISSESISYSGRQDVINAITDYGTAEQNPTPGYSFNVDTSNLDGGNHTITIEVLYKDAVLATSNLTFYFDTAVHIKYSAHVAEVGWQGDVLDGETIGTIGRALRIEALRVELINAPATAHIKYRVYIEGTGWTEYVQDGEQAGTTGQRKKVQAIQMKIEGLEGYIVEYQAHMQELGWQAWAANEMEAGTTRQGLRMEALKIRLVKEENSVVPQVRYSVHNSTNGWIDYVKNGVTIGDTTNGVKLDDIKVAIENSSTTSIKYRVHVQERGWLPEVQNDAQAGTSSSENGIEAIEIQLDGSEYSIEYRVYIIGQGWQNWVRDGMTAGTTGKDLQVGAVQIRMAIKNNSILYSNFSDLDESKYPGYKERLQELQNQHPNWIITIDYTGLDWNTVINNEDSTSNGSPKSLTQYTNEWRSGDPTPYEPGWYRASRAAIEYMMDPRNSFDDEYVFQFQDLTSSAGTYSDIAGMIEGTFLTRYQTSSTDSIINTILDSASEYNVSPFHLVSRMLQEQGVNGGSLNGYVYNGRTVYNLFNIGAYNTDTATSIENGAAYAYNNHWFTPETCIEGSASYLNTGYLSRGQTTLYYQKYNVVAEPYYLNQYMTNIRAANDEGQRIGKEYKENGLIDSQFEFKIPVYENMPTNPCPRPSGSLY